jgi:hypothetical protein
VLYTPGGGSVEHVMTNILSADFIGSRDNETKRKGRFRIVTIWHQFLACFATVCGPEKQKNVKFSFIMFERMHCFFLEL